MIIISGTQISPYDVLTFKPGQDESVYDDISNPFSVNIDSSPVFVPVFISLQVMIAASVVNFLNFSLRISPQEPSAKMLLILGLLTFYLLEFSIVFYIYSNKENRDKGQLYSGFRLVSFEKSDWWGEDRP